jgi:hypothetical protein
MLQNKIKGWITQKMFMNIDSYVSSYVAQNVKAMLKKW